MNVAGATSVPPSSTTKSARFVIATNASSVHSPPIASVAPLLMVMGAVVQPGRFAAEATESVPSSTVKPPVNVPPLERTSVPVPFLTSVPPDEPDRSSMSIVIVCVPVDVSIVPPLGPTWNLPPPPWEWMKLALSPALMRTSVPPSRTNLSVA